MSCDQGSMQCRTSPSWSWSGDVTLTLVSRIKWLIMCSQYILCILLIQMNMSCFPCVPNVLRMNGCTKYMSVSNTCKMYIVCVCIAVSNVTIAWTVCTPDHGEGTPSHSHIESWFLSQIRTCSLVHMTELKWLGMQSDVLYCCTLKIMQACLVCWVVWRDHAV